MNKKRHSALETFWNKGVFDYFIGLNNVNIHYAYFLNTPNSPVIIISPGRCESYLKYQENILDLFNSGYSIFILDHRGQGLSGRLLTNLHKGHVDSFDDYAKDLHQFITIIVKPHSHNNPLYLLAHSMGSAISIRMFQLFPKVVNKSVLLSPMIAINTGLIPYSLATPIIKISKKINQYLSNNPWYFIGQSNYKSRLFFGNRLTHSEKRYRHHIDLYRKKEDIQLGGVTIHWLDEALKTKKNIFAELHSIDTPICLIQAGADTIVDNSSHIQFSHKLHKISPEITAKEPIVIGKALHELLFEVDELRNETLSEILSYLAV